MSGEENLEERINMKKRKHYDQKRTNIRFLFFFTFFYCLAAQMVKLSVTELMKGNQNRSASEMKRMRSNSCSPEAVALIPAVRQSFFVESECLCIVLSSNDM